MKKIIITLVLCFVSAVSAQAQYNAIIKKLLKDVKDASYYDSTQLFISGQKAIEKAIELKAPEAIPEVYIYYGNYFYYTRKLERATAYFVKARNDARLHHNRHIELLASIRLLFLEYEGGYNDNIEKDLDAIYEESELNKDYENMVEIKNLMGIFKEENNQLQEAAKLYLDGLKISEEQDMLHYPAVFCNNLGLIKLYTEQTDDALKDFQKGLEIAKKENDTHLINHIEINICLIYISTKQINKALDMFKDVIAYARSNNHPRELASAFINLGAAFNNIGNGAMALSYSDSAISVLKNNTLTQELTKAYLSKAEVLIALNRNSEAKEVLGLANELIKKSGSLEDKATYFLLQYRIEKNAKHFEQALNHYLSFRETKDSIQQTANGRIIQGLQIKYNVQKKEIELEKEKSKYLSLEKINQEEKFIKWLIIGISIIVIIIIISFFSYRYSVKLREKQESFSRQLIENIEEDRLRISMDLHDDIGQSLSMIKSKISTSKCSDIQEEKILESELSRVIELTRQISRNLYPSYLEKIGLVRSVARLMENTQSSTQIECSFDVTDKVELLPISTKTHLYRILQECTNNTIKHAKATALKVEITEADGEFAFYYQDNGVGITHKQKEGLGLLSIKERAKIIKGQVNFEDKPNKSFKLTVKFKHTL